MIDDRVRDILRVKFIVGLFDKPYQLDLAAADEIVDGPENNAVALQASRESIVLLKNTDATLPLDVSRLKKIAVIGPNADETSYAGAHYGPLMTNTVSVSDGLEDALEGVAEVVYSKGCELVDANMGGGQRTCGENKSRTSLDLPGDQELLLMALKKNRYFKEIDYTLTGIIGA